MKNKMKILIVGGGTVGVLLIEKLMDSAQLIVVERDLERCEKLSEKYESLEVIHAKAEDTDFLMQLDIKKFDIIFVVTGNQSVNIVSSLYLKHIGANKIVCKLNTPNYIEMLNNMSIETVCEDVVTADELIRRAFNPALSKLFSSEIKLEKVENNYVGFSVQELLRKNIWPVIIERGETIYIPSNDEVVREEDILYILKQSKNSIL